jgi:hypothetical protein
MRHLTDGGESSVSVVMYACSAPFAALDAREISLMIGASHSNYC